MLGTTEPNALLSCAHVRPAVAASQRLIVSNVYIMFYALHSSRLIIYRPESTAVQPSGGRLNNAAEYAFTKLDDLVNWARRVS